MSVYSAAQLAVPRQDPAQNELHLQFRGFQRSRTTPHSGDGGTPTPGDPNATNKGADLFELVGRIATYIPTEGVALYIAGAVLSVNTPPGGGEPVVNIAVLWTAFVVCLVVNAIVAAGVYNKTAQDQGKPVDVKQLSLLLITMLALSTIYVATIPENPILMVIPIDSRIVLLVAAALAFAMPWLAKKVGLVARAE